MIAAALAGGLAVAGAGCEPAERAQARATQPALPRPNAPQAAIVEKPIDRAVIRVPAGSFELGSLPGTNGRNPANEADLVAVQLPAFEIERLPYPGDAAQAPRTSLDRDEATALCAQRGKRLCSEAEWERACKGPDGATFISGLREWTSSSVATGLGNPLRTAVLRGADKRCAARTGATPDTRANDLGVRCCSGETPSFQYPSEPTRELVKPLALDTSAARALLAKVPALAKLATSFQPFNDADVSAALRRGGQSRESLKLWTFMPSIFAWSPSPGEELWVLSGRTSQGALLALLYPLPDGRVVHATSSVIAEPDTTLAIGSSATYPNQLTWTTCYSCAGEGGTIRFTDDARIEIGYR